MWRLRRFWTSDRPVIPKRPVGRVRGWFLTLRSKSLAYVVIACSQVPTRGASGGMFERVLVGAYVSDSGAGRLLNPTRVPPDGAREGT